MPFIKEISGLGMVQVGVVSQIMRVTSFFAICIISRISVWLQLLALFRYGAFH
jgi:hypothetical protein